MCISLRHISNMYDYNYQRFQRQFIISFAKNMKWFYEYAYYHLQTKSVRNCLTDRCNET